MPAANDIHIRPSGKTRRDFDPPNIYYRFEDGLVMRAITAFVWCSDCQDVTKGEVLEVLEELDALIDRYSRMLQQSRLPELRLRDLLSQTIQKRRWIQDRVSAPKCLQCGSTVIQVIPLFKEVEVEGNAILICSSVIWSGDWGERRYLSPEGDWLKPDPSEDDNESQAKKWWQFWR